MSYAFAARIRPGQTDALRRLVAECLGPRRAEWEDMQRRSGVTEEAYWLQSDPEGDFFIVVSNSDQLGYHALMANPQTEFDRWFRDQDRAIFAGEPVGSSPAPRNEFLGEWRDASPTDDS